MTYLEEILALHTIVLPLPYPMRSVNVYLIDGEDLTLIDTGPKTTEAMAALQAGLAKLGYALPDIRWLIITHTHPDHFGLASQIIAKSGARLYTHRCNLHWLTELNAERQRYADLLDSVLRRAGAPKKAWAFLKAGIEWYEHHADGVSTDAIGGLLEDGDVLPLGGAPWEVLHTPGHTAGLICLYQRENGTFISSDLLVPGVNFSPFLEPPSRDMSHRSRPVTDYLKSVERIEDMDVRVILPGHGQPAHNHRTLITQQRAFCETRRQQILGVLDKERKTAYQIWEALFPALHPLDIPLGISEILSYLDVLQEEQKVTIHTMEGLDYYGKH